MALVAGDAALVWDQLFVVGILFFALAHFFYIKVKNTLFFFIISAVIHQLLMVRLK